MLGTLYIDTCPFIGGAQLSLMDELGRDPDAIALLSGWAYDGSISWRRLETHHWEASLAGAWRLFLDSRGNAHVLKKALDEFRPSRLYLNTARSALFLALSGVRTDGVGIILRDRDTRMPHIVPRFLEERLAMEVSAVSERVASKWRRTHVSVQPNVLNADSIRQTIPYKYPWDGPVAIQVADFVQWKRHDLFLKAIAEARVRNPNIHGVIKGRVHTKGDSIWLEKILRLRASLGLEDAVMIETSDTSALPYIAGADMLVSCAEDEPFGRAIEEARILGKRIIRDARALATELSKTPRVLEA